MANKSAQDFQTQYKYKLIRHTDDIQNHEIPHSLLLRIPFVNEKIINYIKEGTIKEILGTEKTLKLYEEIEVEKKIISNPALIWSNYCANKFPKQPKNIIGITGTNGKTSTCSYIEQILTKMKIPNICIGTIGVYINGQQINSNLNSTPDAYIIHKLLNEFAKEFPNGYAIIETTSIGIAEYRTHNIESQIAICTNITTDHLDYHKTMENYIQTKFKLAKYTKKFLVHESVNQNQYPKYGNELIGVEFLENSSIFKYKIDEKYYEIPTKLLGNFNAKNVLSAIIALKEFMPIEKFINHISTLEPTNGRLNRYENVIIDFAHTLDAIENVFETVKHYYKKRIIAVIGFGGNVKTMKPDFIRLEQISEYLQKNANIVIITNDNPRYQNPMEIALASQRICTKGTIELDREKALRKAINLAKEGDIVLVLSKGHESYIEFENEIRVPYSDKETVLKIINENKQILSTRT